MGVSVFLPQIEIQDSLEFCINMSWLVNSILMNQMKLREDNYVRGLLPFKLQVEESFGCCKELILIPTSETLL